MAKGALDGALRPGEKKQLRKDKIEVCAVGGGHGWWYP